MALFTFVLEHGGGTFISQVSASDEQQAFSRWMEHLRTKAAEDGISTNVYDAFAEEDEDNLVAISGIEAVWCATTVADEVLVLVNVIRTQAS